MPDRMARRFHNAGNPTGAQLAAARKAAGLTQSELASKAGISRDAVSYWKCLDRIDPRGWAVRKMAEADPGIAEFLRQSAPIRAGAGMGLSPVSSMQENVSPQKDPRQNAVARVMRYFPAPNARAGDGSNLSALEREFQAIVARELIRMQEREAERAARRRVRCEAKTTRKGTPCKNMSEPGRRRCKHHGGRSTGPKTAEGKARIAEAQRARWARWRANKVEAEDSAGILWAAAYQTADRVSPRFVGSTIETDEL